MGKVLIPVKFRGRPPEFEKAVASLPTVQEGREGVFVFGVTFDPEDPQAALISATVDGLETGQELARGLIYDLTNARGVELAGTPKASVKVPERVFE